MDTNNNASGLTNVAITHQPSTYDLNANTNFALDLDIETLEQMGIDTKNLVDEHGKLDFGKLHKIELNNPSQTLVSSGFINVDEIKERQKITDMELQAQIRENLQVIQSIEIARQQNPDISDDMIRDLKEKVYASHDLTHAQFVQNDLQIAIEEHNLDKKEFEHPAPYTKYTPSI